jgi:hypothetical protein
MDLRELNSKVFAECLHSSFQIAIPGGSPLTVELSEVTERNDSPKLEQFYVIFHSSGGEYLPQAMYTLKHEKLGDIELFLTPIGPSAGSGANYQAVFNRFRPQGSTAV